MTTVITYVPNKPDKYAIRFYAVVGNKYKYMFSIMDIFGKKNKDIESIIPPIQKYTYFFSKLRTPLEKNFTTEIY